MTGLVERLYGPHEWGYRDPVEGGFIEDATPFEAADALSRATDEEGLARVLHTRFEARAKRRGRLLDRPYIPDTWESLSPGRTRDFIDDARAIIDHIKGEKKDG